MMRQILVAYASRFGTTAEIAQEIGRVLEETGARADVRRANEVGGIDAYDAVVVGAPLYAGRWMNDAVAFVDRNRTELAGRPVAFFAAGLSPIDGTEDGRHRALRALEAVLERFEEIRPVQVEVFAGALEPWRLPFYLRLLVRLGRMPRGDFRDWEAIRAWARGLAGIFLGERPPPEIQPPAPPPPP